MCIWFDQYTNVRNIRANINNRRGSYGLVSCVKLRACSTFVFSQNTWEIRHPQSRGKKSKSIGCVRCRVTALIFAFGIWLHSNFAPSGYTSTRSPHFDNCGHTHCTTFYLPQSLGYLQTTGIQRNFSHALIEVDHFKNGEILCFRPPCNLWFHRCLFAIKLLSNQTLKLS